MIPLTDLAVGNVNSRADFSRGNQMKADIRPAALYSDVS